MREPYFWRVTDKRSRASAPMTKLLLTPLAMAYSWAGKRRIERTTPEDAGLPVVCIGNLTLGGAGKTPVTAAVRRHLVARGVRAASLSRGYGGSEEGPLKVDPAKHTAANVGDEPLMLAATGEAWISKDRVAGARAMKADGVQRRRDGRRPPEPDAEEDCCPLSSSTPACRSAIAMSFRRGRCASPSRAGLSRADAVVLMGDGESPPELGGFAKPILRARLEPLAHAGAGALCRFRRHRPPGTLLRLSPGHGRRRAGRGRAISRITMCSKRPIWTI